MDKEAARWHGQGGSEVAQTRRRQGGTDKEMARWHGQGGGEDEEAARGLR